jgi:hypothetical protein
MILFSLLAGLLFYRLIQEKWTKTEDILLIVFLAGGMINSGLIERQRKRQNKKISDESQN